MTDKIGGVKSPAVNYGSPPESCARCGCSEFTRRCRASGYLVQFAEGGQITGGDTDGIEYQDGHWQCDDCGRFHRMPAAEFIRLLHGAVDDPAPFIAEARRQGLLPDEGDL